MQSITLVEESVVHIKDLFHPRDHWPLRITSDLPGGIVLLDFLFFSPSFCSATELSRNPSFSYSKQPLFRGRQWTVSRMTARCTRIEKRRSVSPCNANCDILWNCPRTDIPIMLALGLRFACPYSHLRSPRLEFQLGFYLSQNEFEEEFVGRKMGERRLYETFAICHLWFIFRYVYFRYTYTGNNFFYLHERFFQRYENRYRVKNNRKDKLTARRKNDSMIRAHSFDSNSIDSSKRYFSMSS